MAKRPYQVVSRASRKVIGRSEMSGLTERMHQVAIQAQEGTWRCRRSQDMPRLIRTTVRFLRTLNTMGNDPRARRMSATSI